MFEWTQKRVCELIETAKNAPSRRVACREFAARHDLTEAAVTRYLYKLIRKDPELDRELPKGESPIKRKPVEQVLNDALEAKGGPPLTEKDIQAAADRAGVSYATAFGTYGKMSAAERSDEDGNRELARLQKIITNLNNKVRANEVQLEAQTKSFEAREKVYQATIDRLTADLENERERNRTLKAGNDDFVSLIAQEEKLAMDKDKEVRDLKLQLITLEELAQANLIVSNDLNALAEKVAERASIDRKAAKIAVVDTIANSVIHRTWRQYVADIRSETRLNLLRKVSAAEANAPHEELRQLKKQIQSVRTVNLYLLSKLSRQKALA